MDDPFDAGRLAALLEEARRTGRAMPARTLPIPPDAATAYRVQAARSDGRRVPGWKVALDGEGRSIAAPLDPVGTADAPVPWRPGLAIEVEIAFVLAADLPARPDRPYARDEVEGAVGSVHLGVEVVASRIAEGSGAPFPLFLADALANAGYVFGPALAEPPVQGSTLRVEHRGRVLFDGVAAHAQADPLLPLVARANRPDPGWGDLHRGQVVTTGSLCGVLVPDGPGDLVVALGATRMVARLREGSC